MTDFKPRDAGDGAGWDNAIDWLLNSRYMDPEALEHFWHLTDEVTDCDWCNAEVEGTNWDHRTKTAEEAS